MLIMPVGYPGRPSPFWPVLVLVLTAAYLLQAAPHGHAGDFRCAPPWQHGAHGDQTRIPADGADDRRSPGSCDHQHYLAQHLDVHSLRPGPGVDGRHHGNPALPAAPVEPVRLSSGPRPLTAAPAGPAPDDPLLLHAPPRAPPA